MPQCEMCGREADLYIVIIEGAEMKVCKEDAKFGKVLRAAYVLKTEKAKEKPKLHEKEVVILFNQEFPKLMRQKRESMGLTQEELGKKLNERTSIIHQLESGHMQPSVELARKLEKQLKIDIVEQYEEKHTAGTKPKSETLTIGDMIKFKTK